ncbi:MAG TPA: YciI family protein [Opitutaceae bacterium]|nr:YciI family protein [Opitutaceae bacterium]
MSLEPTSPYLLIFRDTSPDLYRALSPEERVALLNRWRAWAHQLKDTGKLVQGSPLADEGRVVKGPRGRHVVDGPYAESKEEIVGYFLVNAADFEEATAIAGECPGLPHGMVVEIRPLADCCAVSRTLEVPSASSSQHEVFA